MSKPILGKIIKIEVRKTWSNEASDFTPWLAANIDILAEEIGLDLEVIGTEQNVGTFKADLLCKEVNTGDKVLVENQFGKTDHKHLGQLLTYARGLEVKKIIWVAEQFTDEHRAALDWLNEIADKSFGFFGVEVSTIQIDNSLPAPQFKVISQPDDWSKAIREQEEALEYSDLQKLRLSYWTAYKDFLSEGKSSIKPQKPSVNSWMNYSIGTSGLHLFSSLSFRKKLIVTGLWIDHKNSKEKYDALYEQKDVIEKEFGEQLNWQRLSDKHACSISLSRAGEIDNKGSWPKQFDWFEEKLKKLDKVFRNRVKDLD